MTYWSSRSALHPSGTALSEFDCSQMPILLGTFVYEILGPVVQSVVSLTSSLRVISLTILADSIYNILIFFAEKMCSAKATHIFSAKNFSIFAYHLM